MPSISLPVFVEAAARASVILAATGLVAAALRRSSASARHLVWALGLTSALVVPALSATLPRWELPVVRTGSGSVTWPAVGADQVVSARREPPAEAGSVAQGNYPRGAGDLWAARGFTQAKQSFADDLSVTTILLALWALGAALVLGRMLLGLITVERMSRRTRVISGGAWHDLARELAKGLGLRRVRFVQSATTSMPMAWGLFRASVLMPADADAWPAHRLRVVLLHELAHVKRRDCLTHVVAQIVCAAYWFNPLAWIAVRKLRRERERACDDLVLQAGTRGSDYAEQLLDIARLMQSQRFPALLAGASLAMAHRSQLEGRLMAILDPSVSRRGLTRARAAAAVALFAILILSVASVQPWAEAPAVTNAAVWIDPQPQTVTPDRAGAVGAGAVQGKPDTAGPARVPTADRDKSRATPGDLAENISAHVANSISGAVGGVVGGVVDGVVGGVISGVAGGVAESVGRAVEAAVPFAQASPNPNPNPNPRPRDGQSKMDPRAAAALMDALKDSDKEVRETAMHALVQARDPRMLEPLVAALKDASPDVREQAVFGLGQLHDPRAVEPLMTVLHDTNPDVRQNAVFALGQLRDKRAVEPLISALKDGNADVRQQAAFALGQLRDARALEALVVALKDGDADVRGQAAFALGQLRDPRAVDGLTAAMKDSNADVRRQAAFALGQIRY